MVQETPDDGEKIALSLCDGLGTALHVLEELHADVTRYVGVELDSTTRTLSDNLNEPERSACGGVDHSWHCDVFSITREDVKALGQGKIKLLAIQAPCQDHSPLRLLPGRNKGKKKGVEAQEARPGFKGKHGSVFLRCLEIFGWVMEFNPECEYLVEHLKFDDMPEDWALVCAAMGTPMILDAADWSASRRNRAWWTNIQLPESWSELTDGYGPVDANQFMQAGRTLEPYVVEGKTTIRTVCSSWSGDPNSPVANTTLPVIVHDEAFEKAQHLRPPEAEGILGFPKNSTAGRGATAKDRLKAIGNAWDVRVATMLLRFSSVVRVKAPDLKSMIVALAQNGDDELICELLAGVDMPVQMEMLEVLQNLEGEKRSVMYAGSVLDSGSSKHLSAKTCVTHSDDLCSLTGFNNTVSWTQGNGYLPATLYDSQSNQTVAVDFEGADKMNGLAADVLSMGKLLRDGWKFYFEDKDDCYAVHPSGQCKFKVELSDDDLLRLPHGIRTGKESVPLSTTSGRAQQQNVVMHVKRTAEAYNAAQLHSIFCHRSKEKIYRTLQHTKGYTATRLPDVFCDICAQTKAHRRGLRSKKADSNNKMMLVPAAEYADEDDDEDGDMDNLEEVEYVAPVAGRSKGVQPVPRFELQEIRPFEIMFADNKDYEMPVRGGRQVSFVLYDLKSTAKFAVDVFSKAHNGNAFRRIMALNGVHKLPYRCTIYTDGCGSMVHVELAAVLMGIDHVYVPPYEQSLNESEKICNFIWDDAAAIMQESKAPLKLFNMAVQFALYADMRSASTAERGYLTPYEIIKGTEPSIVKMHRFYTLSFVAAPKQKRKALAKKGFLGRAEMGRLLGFQSIYSSTFKVMLDGERLVHSINVTFDDSNYVHGKMSSTVEPPGINIDMSFANNGSTMRGASDEMSQSETSDNLEQSPAVIQNYGLPSAHVQIEHCDLFDEAGNAAVLPEYHGAPAGEGSWLWQAEEPQPRPRPQYTFLCKVEDSLVVSDPDESQNLLMVAVRELVAHAKNDSYIDHGAIAEAQRYLALSAVKDIQWKKALQGEDRDKAIAAFHAERDALLDTVLMLIPPEHPEYEDAKDLAITGRYLLDVRRNGMYKARGVKHGFKEDKATADGPGFVYYTHLAKLHTFRMAFFRPNRDTRRVAIRDVKTAFLQSDEFPPHIVKYLRMLNPITLEYEHFKQKAPLYGEYSAPVRWEDTYAPYYESEGFTRGDNEKAVFYHDELDLLILVYVDDNYMDAEEDSIHAGSEMLSDRFDCKELEWLNADMQPLDYLGMELLMSSYRMYVSMEKYIHYCLEALGWTKVKTARIPIAAAIDGSTPALDAGDNNLFHRGLGFLSWLNMTARLDVAQAFSRIGQHQASPTESALNALK